MDMSVIELVFGRALRSEEEQKEQIGAASGVPCLGLDALASSSYGPEAALTLLMVLGVAGTRFLVPITAVVVVLLLLVHWSYRQTIAAYPDGGGSYSVAKENLGPRSGVLAAAALALDYVLNVTVGISAGVAALASAVPSLLPHTLALCFAMLVLLTIVNLRGVRETGLVFIAPTYLFVGLLGAAVVIGLGKVLLAGGHPSPVATPASLPPAAQTATLWLLLRSFASGSTAMTGVEAVSNGVPMFRQPTVANARRTQTLIIAILVLLLAGIATLCWAYRIGATVPGQPGYQSVVSQVVAAVEGRGLIYYATMASVFAVLLLSANTSFAVFPRLCRLLALDNYLPEAFAHRGRRLVYTPGIVLLSLTSGLLLVLYGGITDRLIPLFALAAFLAFTMSQLGMVAHWWKRRGQPFTRRSLLVNGAGALATGVTVLIVAVAKFTEGAAVAIFIVPALLWMLRRSRRYYEAVEREVTTDQPLLLTSEPEPIVVVLLQKLDHVGRKGLRFAAGMSRDVRAVHVAAEDAQAGDLVRRWRALVDEPARAAGITPPSLEILPSTYREWARPLVEYVRRVGRSAPDRFVVVIVPEVVPHRWYQHVLLNHRAAVLKSMLVFQGGPRTVVMTAPWYLTRPELSPPAAPRHGRSGHPSDPRSGLDG